METKRNIKIAYIGGGSKQWARVFMYDLALCNDLCGEIGLYDIDYEAAVRNQRIGERINEAAETVSSWNYVVYDNLEKSAHISQGEINSLLADCNDSELRALAEIIKTTKSILRKR